MLRWQAYLTIERVTWEERAAVEVLRRSFDHRVDGLGEVAWSLRSLVLEMLASRDLGRRANVARGLEQASAEASESALKWAIRRHGAAYHLGTEGLEWLEVPLRDMGVRQVAERVMAGTDDAMAAGIKAESWQEVVRVAAAMDARSGWPAALTPRWFRWMFGGWKSLQGIHLELGPLCDPICGASFARALARFGGAIHRGWAMRSQGPFSMVHRPFDAAAASYGALLASLLTSVPFLKRRMGLGRDAARIQARSLGLSLLISVRMNAAQAIVATMTSPQAMVEAHVTEVSKAMHASIPETLAGVVPRYEPRAASRLCGALHAMTRLRELVERFDDDWFDNPQAHEFLSEIDISERLVLDEHDVRQGVENMSGWLSEWLLG
jgi:hypothetical protein